MRLLPKILDPTGTCETRCRCDHNLQQVTEQLGSANAGQIITAEEGAGMMDELEANAPFVEQRHDNEVTMAIKAALTDAELFVSYNMPAKALDPLIAVLPKAPRDLRLNQRLAALHTQAGRFAEAAVCCRTLESIYHDAGYADEASRYSDLAVKYEQRVAPGGAKSRKPGTTSGEPAAPIQEFEIASPTPDPFAEAAHEQTLASRACGPRRERFIGSFWTVLPRTDLPPPQV